MPEEYILQCRLSFEVQRLWKPQDGDFYIDYRIGREVLAYTKFMEGDCEFPGGYIDSEFCDWLPRLDQLIKIIRLTSSGRRICTTAGEGEIEAYFNFTIDLYHEMATGEKKYPSKSWEQLLLGYLMARKFNKTWIDKEWRSK